VDCPVMSDFMSTASMQDIPRRGPGSGGSLLPWSARWVVSLSRVVAALRCGTAVAAAAELAGSTLLVNTPMNYSNACERAAQLVATGRIGTIEHIACHMEGPLRDLMAGEPMVETESDAYRPPPSTWADPERAGGYAWGQMSHILTWVFKVSGLQASQAFAFMGNSPAGVDFYDSASVRCTNGATISVSGAGTIPKHHPGENQIRIFGSEGMLVYRNGHGYCSDHRAATLTLTRHDSDDLELGPDELDGAATSALESPDCEQ
jgi:predicted dehydrogenase